MQRFYPLVIVAFSLSFCSCKKFIQKQEENAVLSIMTTGSWQVTGYKQNDTDITASFSGYLFKFDANNTVTATKANTSVQGQWLVNITSRTIFSNFPDAGNPLVLLNKTWTIKDSYTDSVSAWSIDTVLYTTNILQLKK
jgi:hypothetical protein